MFIASFGLKTSIQRWLLTLQDFWDFPRLHPAREMKRLPLQESTLPRTTMICTLKPNTEGGHTSFCSVARSMGEGWVDATRRSTLASTSSGPAAIRRSA
jgi:hypothetical protein